MSDVSAVIPLFNKRRTIARAIESVLAQTQPPREIVVVDDGSSDGSIDVVEPFKSRGVRVVRQANAGPGAARNRGVSESVGAYVAFLDADDEWRPGHIETGLRLIAESSATAYVCGYDAPDSGGLRPNIIATHRLAGMHSIEDGTDGQHLKTMIDALHSSCVIVSRSHFEQLGGFFDRYKCLYGEDSWFYARLLADGGICYDAAPDVVFHVEDSALGFAVTKREAARPLSLYGNEIARRYTGRARRAFELLVDEYRRLDIEALVFAGAFREAWRLRRIDGQLGMIERGRDIARYLRWNSRARASKVPSHATANGG